MDADESAAVTTATVSFSGNPDRVRQFRAVMHGLTRPSSGGEIVDADGITAFISTRAAEAEALARDLIESEAAAAEWTEPTSGVLVTGPPEHDDTWSGTHPLGDSRLTRFIAANDPAHVLRQAAAIRRILDRHHDDGEGWCTGCGVSMFDGSYDVEADECREKKDLAAIWETHPEYEAGWKP